MIPEVGVCSRTDSFFVGMGKIQNLGIFAIKGKSPLRGIKQSPSLIKKRSDALKNHFVSQETKYKISMALKGRPSKRRGIKTGLVTKGFSGRKHSLETKLKMSIVKKGIIFSDNWRRNMGHKKDKHWNWQGGITSETLSLRKSIDLKLWRETVFNRDNYICQMCGKKGSGNLQADHKLPFSIYPELRFDINNGQTLCINCHIIKTKEDWFLIKERRKSERIVLGG